jgi:hypothetical protein
VCTLSARAWRTNARAHAHRYDVVVPHGASMKEIDRLLRIQQRQVCVRARVVPRQLIGTLAVHEQRGKKELAGAREHVKKAKEADIRGNRQRARSCDWEE